MPSGHRLALGRRIETHDYTVAAEGCGSSSMALLTRHIYNGLAVIEEHTACEPATGAPTWALAREFLWGDRFPEPLVLIDHTDLGDKLAGDPTGPEVLHYVRDALGSVVGLVDAGNAQAQPPILPALVERYDYDPYGHTYIESGDGLERRTASKYGNPFAWTGQRYDAGVGLYHFLYRSYSPELGRWLQRDPAGYVDGTNLYEYARSSPAVYVDPMGLMALPPDSWDPWRPWDGGGGDDPVGPPQPPNPDPCGGGDGADGEDGDADGDGEEKLPELTGDAAALVNALEAFLERNPDHWLRQWIEDLIRRLYGEAERAKELLNEFIETHGVVINPMKPSNVTGRWLEGDLHLYVVFGNSTFGYWRLDTAAWGPGVSTWELARNIAGAITVGGRACPQIVQDGPPNRPPDRVSTTAQDAVMIHEWMLHDEYYHVLFNNSRDSAYEYLDSGLPAGEMVFPPVGPGGYPVFRRPDGTLYVPGLTH